jgi:hypothetical protein
MLFPILLLLIFFVFNNYKRAQSKGLNATSWIVGTILSVGMGIFLACFILGIIIMTKNPNLLVLAQTNDRVRMNEFMLSDFARNEFLYTSLITAGAYGGYLLVRYLIEKKEIQ